MQYTGLIQLIPCHGNLMHANSFITLIYIIDVRMTCLIKGFWFCLRKSLFPYGQVNRYMMYRQFALLNVLIDCSTENNNNVFTVI